VTLNVPITQIDAYPHQPDRRLRAEVESLADSIEEHGQLHPAIGRIKMGEHVLTDLEQKPSSYLQDGSARVELVSGHRRWQAMHILADRAGMQTEDMTLEVDVRPLTDAEAAEIHYQENDEVYAQSKVQQAELMASYKDTGLSNGDIADRFGVSRTLVGQRIKILDLPPKVLDEIEHGDISYSAAKVIADAWRLTHKETRQVEAFHAADINELRTHLVETARDGTHKDAKKALEQIITEALAAQSPEDQDGGKESTPQVESISAVSSDLQPHATEDKAKAENAHNGEAQSADTDTSDGSDTIAIHVEGDIKPGEYILRAPLRNTLTSEQKDKAARTAAHLLMTHNSESDAVQDLTKIIAWSLGMDTHTSPFAALEALIQQGLEKGSLDSLSLPLPTNAQRQ